VRIAPRPEAVGKPEKLLLIDGVQHLGYGPLDDLVFQGWKTDRTQSPVRLRYLHALHRLCPVGSPLQPIGELSQILRKALPIVLPCLSVDPGRRSPVNRVVAKLQHLRRIDMVHQRGESLPPVSFRCLAYPFERTWHACPARSPVRGLPQQVPLGQPASLRCLCRPLQGLIRQLLRYYQVVRLPPFVHHWRESLDFPMRPLPPSWPPANRGSPGSRVRCFRACPRSSTAQGLPASRAGDALGMVFRIVPLRRHPELWRDFTAQYLACTYPCQRFSCGIAAAAA
jgi:hypothetical protein